MSDDDILRLTESGDSECVQKRIAELEADLMQARHLLEDHGPECRNVTSDQFVELRDDLARVTKERDELLTKIKAQEEEIEEIGQAFGSTSDLSDDLNEQREKEEKTANRYRYLRMLAMHGQLESFVALGRYDHIRDADKIDEAIDAAIGRLVFTT